MRRVGAAAENAAGDERLAYPAMGLLDEAIREHLELKRQHGADEDEVARQETEALGPVSVEELEAETSLDPLHPPDADEAASPDGPFDRAAEAGLTGERDTPSFEWHGSASNEIEVPSFVPAEPEPGPASSSEPPAGLEPPAKLEAPADLEPRADVETPADLEAPDDLETPGDVEPPAPAERSAEEGGPPITDMPTELFEPLDVEGASGADEPLESERLGDVEEFREDEARLEGEEPLPPPPSSDVDPRPGEPAFGAEDEVALAPDPSGADLPAEVEPPLAEERAGLEPSIPVDDHEPLAERGPIIEGEQVLVEPEDLEPPEEPSVESLALDALDEPVEPAPAQSSDERPEEAPVTGEWPAPGPAFARDPVEEEPFAGDLSQEEPAPIEAPLDDSGFSGPVAESEARTMEPEPVEHAPLGEPPVDELGPADALARDEAIEEPLEETALYELPPAAGDPQADEPLADEPLAEEPLAEEPLADEPLAEGPLADEPLAEGPLAEHDVAGAPFAEERLIEEESRVVSESSIAESREPDVPAVPESAHRDLGEALDPTGAEPSPEWGVVDQPTASFAVEEELAAGATGNPKLSSADPLEPEPLETEPDPLTTEPESLAGEPEPPGRAEPEDQLEDSLYLDEERNGPAEIIDDESADPESRSARGFFEDTVEHEGVRRGEGSRPDADFEG